MHFLSLTAALTTLLDCTDPSLAHVSINTMFLALHRKACFNKEPLNTYNSQFKLKPREQQFAHACGSG